jgi:hypothetical protein
VHAVTIDPFLVQPVSESMLSSTGC